MNECNIVQDLLPLYADDLASEDSVEFINRHAKNCPKCRDIWRRYKGELPITHPVVPEIEEENVLEPLHREVTKFIWKFIGNAVLVVLLVGAFLGYLGWETGYFPVEAEFPAPSAKRSVELIDLDEAGFFSDERRFPDETGTLIQFRFGMGNLFRHGTPWENVQAHWAPDSNRVLLTMQNQAGAQEMRLVDIPAMLAEGGGTFEIPGLFPSEEQPDLTAVLTGLCRNEAEFPKAWETINFTFTLWGEDSETVTLSFETDSGEKGFVDYHVPSGEITRVYHPQ